MMPSSKKGRGRKRIERKPVPITASLAALLRRAGSERPPTAPLLTKSDGTPWRPTRVVRAQHDTSVPMLERTYSQHILDHSDTVARRGLLDTAQPAVGNIISLPGRRS
jgi:hypothetical protein